MKNYRSSIPRRAVERVVSTFESGRKEKAEYLLDGKVVGVREFYETGELNIEHGLKDGLMHGISYRCDVPGELLSAEPYVEGLAHGVAKQWSRGRKLIGTYTMKHGTGIDLWWVESSEDGTPYLSEARYLQRGKRDGFEWWLNQDQRSVWSECHFVGGQMHGIERSWNGRGRLDRGFPRYWIRDQRATKRQYLRECQMDASLPPYRRIDDQPARTFPPQLKVTPG